MARIPPLLPPPVRAARLRPSPLRLGRSFSYLPSPTMPHTCPIIPLGDRVVILPDPTPERHGSILLAGARWVQPSDRGTVAAVGLGGWDEDGDRVPVELEEGARVVFTRVRGMQVTIGETVWLLVREVDILAQLLA